MGNAVFRLFWFALLAVMMVGRAEAWSIPYSYNAPPFPFEAGVGNTTFGADSTSGTGTMPLPVALLAAQTLDVPGIRVGLDYPAVDQRPVEKEPRAAISMVEPEPLILLLLGLVGIFLTRLRGRKKRKAR